MNSRLIIAIAFLLICIGVQSIHINKNNNNLGPSGAEGNSNSNSGSGATGTADAGDDKGAVIISNQACLNKCVGRKENMCRWKFKTPDKKAACMARCHKECLVCPMTAVKGTCANKCKLECKLGKTAEGTPQTMSCIHGCLEKCPCEDISNELKDLIRLIPDSDLAIPFATNGKEHFSKKTKPGEKPPAPPPPAASGPVEPPALEGLGFPLHLLPSVRSEVHKKPKATLMKMIKNALKKSKKTDEKKKGTEATKGAEKKDAELAEAKALNDPQKVAKLEGEATQLKKTAKDAESKGVLGAKDEASAGADAEDEAKAVEDKEESKEVEKRANAAAAAGDKQKAAELKSEAKNKKKEADKATNEADAKLKGDSDAAAEEADTAATEAEKKLDEAENSGKATDEDIEKLKKDAETKREVADKMKENAKEAQSSDTIAQDEGDEGKKELTKKMKDLANKKAEAEKAAAANDPIKADKLEKEAKKMEMEMKREQQQVVDDAVNAKSAKLEAETKKLEDAAKAARKEGKEGAAERLERKAKASKEAADDQKQAAEASARATALNKASDMIQKEAEDYKKKNDTEAYDKLMKEAGTKSLEAKEAEMEGQAKLNKKMVKKLENAIAILEKVVAASGDDESKAEALKQEIVNLKKQVKVRATALKEAEKTLAKTQEIADAEVKVDEAVGTAADNKTITKLKEAQKGKEKEMSDETTKSEKDLSSADEESEKLEDNSTNAEKFIMKVIETAREAGNVTELKRLEELQEAIKRITEDAMLGIAPKNNSVGKGGLWWEHWDRNNTDALVPLANKMIEEVHTKDPSVVQEHVDKSHKHHKKALEHYENWKSGGGTGAATGSASGAASGATGAPPSAADHKPMKKIEGEIKPKK